MEMYFVNIEVDTYFIEDQRRENKAEKIKNSVNETAATPKGNPLK